MANAPVIDDYDSPWKEAIEQYFTDCLAFFFPHAAAEIDWQQGYEFLDKELQQVVPEAELGRRTVDKLVKVWQKEGNEAWVLIHLEVQSQVEPDFSERMYVYHYRLFDRYRRRVASLAILGDERSNWRPDSYGYELWGCRVRLEFPVVKLLDYRARWAELEQSRNSFAVLVMAHLHTVATRRKPAERYELKWSLIRRLYERGYSRAEILMLFRFVDWLMALPPELDYKFNERLSQYEEEQKMPYITSVERIAVEKGREQGLQQGIAQKGQEDVVEVLKVRFEEVPQMLIESIETITDSDVLKKLHRQAIIVESIAKFKQVLDDLLRGKTDHIQTSPDLST
jgi:hypothetical protein